MGDMPIWTYRTEPNAGMVPKADLDSVYRERNRLVAMLTRIAPRMGWGTWMRGDEDDPGWAVVYIETEAGQMSWHVSAEEAVDLFSHVDYRDDIEWDGHTDDEKYRRLAWIGAS